MEGVGHCAEDALVSGDMFLLQLCNGMDENAVGMCAELIFAPIDASFADDAPLLPSGFRIIPLDPIKVSIQLFMSPNNLSGFRGVQIGFFQKPVSVINRIGFFHQK
ncbi:putative class III homeodomain-leucine zipper family [Helianthus debilis subsp. tardiflorus]